jgi:hypothetical protein
VIGRVGAKKAREEKKCGVSRSGSLSVITVHSSKGEWNLMRDAPASLDILHRTIPAPLLGACIRGKLTIVPDVATTTV